MKKIILIVGLLLMLGLAACGYNSASHNGDESGNPEAKQPANLTEGSSKANGEALYKANCIACHGANLEGTIGSNLQKLGAQRSKEQIADKVQHGGGSMPAFKDKLKDADIQSLAEWLSTKK
ncbi:c-type cytochrome [Paenibacillus agricola]|uniref:Cytochrome c n=1 Tax=Paenibacillus agricola TaxID=2716264 RepID=A0ABX0J5N5_9BACL|nr:cytochrome c [Paenibacillus agricola]NHN30469.1 cytochrome c [Paenibacillus agricola]